MTTTTKEKTEDKSEQEKVQELKAALRHYCRFHLKPGDLEKFPELKNYIE